MTASCAPEKAKFADADHQCRGAEERHIPEEAQALNELSPQWRRLAFALFLERRPHEDDRQRREHVRHRVNEERERAADGEERAAERRPGETHRRRAPLGDARRRCEL